MSLNIDVFALKYSYVKDLSKEQGVLDQDK